MALKNCIGKAGKALDVDDKDYMRGLLAQGRPDEEVLNRLEQNILKERDDLVQILEDQDITVKPAADSEGALSEPDGVGDAPASPQPSGAGKVPRNQSAAVESGVETGSARAEQSETEAKPKSKDAVSTVKPGTWKSGKNGRLTSGNYTIHQTFDASVDAKPFVLNKLSPFKSVGVFRSLAEAKAAAEADFNKSITGPDLGLGPRRIEPGGKSTGSPLFLTKDTVEVAMAKLSEGSEIITRFLGDKTGGISKIIADALEDAFIADTDSITLTGRDPEVDGGRRLNLNNTADFKLQQQIIEHEITHANTIAFLVKHAGEQKDKNVIKDFQGFINAIKTMSKFNADNLSEEAIDRVNYILSKDNPVTAIAEFIAIMGSETATAEEIYTEFNRINEQSESRLKSRIGAFLAKVAEWVSELTNANLQKNVDINKLAGALARTIEHGTAFREQQYQEAIKYQQVEEMKYNYTSRTGEVVYSRKASFDYMNFAVASMLNSRLERKGKQLLGNLHTIMYERFPLYSDAADKARKVYDGSAALQQFLHTVTGEGVNKTKKADVLSKMAAINSQRVSIINEQVKKLENLSRDLSQTEKNDLNSFVKDMPLHDYFVLAGDLSTAEEIDAEAELLRKQLWKINARAVRDVDQLVDWNIEEKPGSTIYNLATNYPPGKKYPTEGFQRDLRKLLALESIKRIGSKKFEKLLKHNELMTVIKDNSVANAVSTLENEGTINIRDSLVMDKPSEQLRMKAVKQKDFRMYEFGEDTGWKVLKPPTRTELGIVYKPTIDSTDIAGAYTDMKLATTDIDVGRDMKNFPGVVETNTGHKLLLTKEQKKELGYIEGFEQSLVRSTAHSMAMTESQVIRDAVLQDDTWMVIGKGRSETKLENIIKADNIDNPWFIKLEEGTEYGKLDASIRAKYMPVQGRASNVNAFNEKVDLVRKDISHWLLGGSAKSLFENPKMKWATRILKNLVSGAKIGMIVLNPVKIANDNLSNLAYLGVLGLNPKFIATNYAEIQRDFAEYTELQRNIFQLKLQLVSRPESASLKKKLKSLQKRVAANSVGDIGDKGFVNSLGSDLVSRSADTLSGFQADMHRSLEYLLTDSAGNRNVVSHFIVQLQKIGYQAEDFFGYLGDIASKAKSTKLLEQELDQVANRLREIKSEEDIVNYVAQFTTSPSSEAVRFGSAMTDLTDVLAKETLFRHLVQEKKMKPADARIHVLDSFPDYKENMPLAIKQLSDVGIIMFPSFWLRIQKIIYRMARDKPVGLATELMAQEMLGSDINTIFEANVINKSNTFGGLLHTPFEPIGLGSVVPVHVF